MKMVIEIDEALVADAKKGHVKLTEIADAVVKTGKPCEEAQITETEYDFLAFYARLLQENPAVAKHIDNMVKYMVSTDDLDDYDKGEFNGTFEVLRSAGIASIHDKIVTRRYIKEAKEKRGA